MRTTTRRTALLAAALVMGLGTGSALASKPLKTSLAATSSAPANARGQAKLQLKSASRGKFQIVAQRLARDTSYDVVVNGVKVATLTTTGGGGGKVKFSTDPKGRDVFLGFDPRGGAVALRAADGTDVLIVDFPTDDVDVPGGSDDTDVACCLPDDSGPECEDRTEAECLAQGGTLAGVNSCLPDPCAGTTPPGGEGDVVCCLPDAADDSASVECEDRTAAECAAGGGTVVQATSCLDAPCAPVAPADLVACCEPDDSGAQCEMRTADRCALRGGTVAPGATSCEPATCDGLF